MPIREFLCDSCGVFEDLVAMDDVVTNCPVCGRKVETIMSVPGGFILNGQGFYTNDYKRMESGGLQRKWPGDEKKNSGNNVVNVPPTNIYEQFDKRRSEERRTEKKKDWKFIAK